MINLHVAQDLLILNSVSINVITLPRDMLTLIFQKYVNTLTRASEILRTYSNMKRICKFLNNQTKDFVHFIKINNVTSTVMSNIFLTMGQKCYIMRPELLIVKDEINQEYAARLKQLFIDNQIEELINIMTYVHNQWYRQNGIRCYNLTEDLISQVLEMPRTHEDRYDAMITELAVQCAKKDARIIAQLFKKIPFTWQISGEEIGKACANKDPVSTLEFLENFTRLEPVRFQRIKIQAELQLNAKKL